MSMACDVEVERPRRLRKRPRLSDGFTWSGRIFVLGMFLGVVSVIGMYIYSSTLPSKVVSVIGQTVVGRVEFFKQVLIYEAVAIFLNNTFVALASSILPLTIAMLEARPEKPVTSMKRSNRIEQVINSSYQRLEAAFFKSGLNLESRARSLCFSMFLLPAAIMVVNGWILGYFGAAQAVQSSTSLVLFLALVLPHGVIEIPAFVLAAAVGYWTVQQSVRFFEVNRYEEFPKMAREMLRSRRVWSPLVAVLFFLATAAYVETYITPYVPASFQLI